jgi:hypothetical protein
MLYCTFTYDRDADMLEMSAARIRQLDANAKIYAVVDSKRPIKRGVPGVTLLKSSFERGGNLRGLQAVGGILASLKHILDREKTDYIIKFDCDLWANDLTPFFLGQQPEGVPEPDYLASEIWAAFQPGGFIYRLSKWAIAAAIRLFNERTTQHLWQEQSPYPEDHIIYLLVLQNRLPHKLIPFNSGFAVGMFDGGPGTNEACHKAGLVHCGEPLSDGSRCSREHATLRMRILKFETEKKK